MKKLLFIVMAMLFATSVFAQANSSASLGGYIWYDKNLDGIQDYGEHEVRGIRVHLLKDGVETGDIKYSDDSGSYLFENLEPGHKYSIRVDLPRNYKSFTKPNVGSDDTKDSDIIRSEEKEVDINGTKKTLIVGYSEEIELNSGDNYRDLDAGMLCRCIAWIDVEKSTNGVNADSSDKAVEVKVGDTITWEYKVINSSKVKISDIVVKDDKEGIIDCPKSSLEPGEEMTCIKTGIAKKGLYRNLAVVSGKDPNGNSVEDEDPSHYLAKTNLACLGDFYWYDENLNGIQDKDEYGVVGIKVELYDENKNLLKSMKTNSEGKYLFCDLEPGNYYVKFGLPDTYLFIPKDRGSDIRDSDASSSGWSHLVELSDGEVDLSVDAGIYCSCDEYKVTGVKRDISAISPLYVAVLTFLMLFIAFTIKPQKR